MQENAYGTQIHLTATLFIPDDSDLINVHGADPQDVAAVLEAMSDEFHAWWESLGCDVVMRGTVANTRRVTRAEWDAEVALTDTLTSPIGDPGEE